MNPWRWIWSSLGLLAAAAQAAGVEPLLARVQTDDAQRFAALFASGRVDADSLQRGYLSGAGRGVVIFTPHRIQSAANLAREVASKRADYAHAIATCLPVADALNAELRAVYLAFKGLLPEARLPAVHLVFGAGNSGGTAAPDAQVIGLEVMCRAGTTVEQFRSAMRRIFAHETVHSLQPMRPKPPVDLLLWAALMEGVPDLLARLVTGLEPSPEREVWARPREAEVWRRFEEDRQRVLAGETDAVMRRWFGNAGSTIAGVPEGWPGELGYWVGLQIAQAYLDRATARPGDPREALRVLLANADPADLLAISGYRGAGPPAR